LSVLLAKNRLPELFPVSCGLIKEGMLCHAGASMPFSKPVLVVAMLSFSRAFLLAAPGADSPLPPILPKQFAGWQMQARASRAKMRCRRSRNAALLKEYGFTDFEAAAYKSDDGRTLKIRAARFTDASGAFGAYTFYLQPGMAREEIGDQGASADRRVLFYRGQHRSGCSVQTSCR